MSTASRGQLHERFPGSCQSFLNDPKTREWLSAGSSPLLWLHGPSATGKSFSCSRLVDHIRTSPETKDDAVACVYFQQSHKQYNLADFNHALSSVLRQLVSQLPNTSNIPQQLAELTDIPYPGEDEYAQLLQQIAAEFGKAFIIFDGANSVTASALGDLMLAINPDSSRPAFRVLFTSRSAPPQDFVAPYQVLDIISRAEENDVKEYINQALREVSAKDLSTNHSDLLQELVQLFDGRQVSSNLDAISKVLILTRFLPVPVWPIEMPESQFLARVNQLVSTCKSASTSERIDAFCKESLNQFMGSPHEDMVMCILYHVVRASDAGYSFTMPMALEALNAWQIHDQDEKPFDEPEVLQGCRGLIFFGEDDKSMHMQSPLLGEYLSRETFKTSYDKRSVSASLRYLSSDTFASGACTSSAALKERLQKNRYLWYAAKMLGPTLAKAAPETLVQDFMQLSSRKGSIESYLQAAEAWPYETEASYEEHEQEEERFRCFTPGQSPLHLAAQLAAPDYLIDALVGHGEDLEARDKEGRTALHIAAEIEGDNSTMRALLGAGSKVSAADNQGNTPLSVAVVYGSLASVKLLLDKGADLSELDEETLEQCGQEKPEIATYLRGLGVEVPENDESDMED
ncbi:hypothetical protein F53441_9702 [Fusarium austroafricanum]|uniref:Peptidase A2 domain-containing protein n=1 Tax=Fusarium austroafricanum TaxID=2364996 RepID=A0A8H4KAY6_9HYPO|nr:hypothetical protein F53441_9702 [Fusarium austroafricanum]